MTLSSSLGNVCVYLLDIFLFLIIYIFIFQIVLSATSGSVSARDGLRLTWLTNSSLTCNDGSPAG